MNQIYKYKLLQGYLDNTSTTPSTDPELINLDFSKNYFHFAVPRVDEYTTGSISISNNSELGTNLTNYYYAIGSGEPTSSTVLKWQKFNGSNISVELSTQYNMYVYFKGTNGTLTRRVDVYPIGTYGALKLDAQYLNFNVAGNINNSSDKENIAKYIGISGDYGSLIYGEWSQYYGAGVKRQDLYSVKYKGESIDTPIVSFINTAIGSCTLNLFNTVSDYPYMFAGSLISNLPNFNFARNIDENDTTDLNTKYTINFSSSYMFADCKNLQSANTPAQPTYLECEGMFSGCENLKTANINIAMDFLNEHSSYTSIIGQDGVFTDFLKNCNNINSVNINFNLGSVDETTKKEVFNNFFDDYYSNYMSFNPLTEILTDLPEVPSTEYGPNYSYIVNVNNVFEQNNYWAEWLIGNKHSESADIKSGSQNFYTSLYNKCKSKNWVLKLNNKSYWEPRFHIPDVPNDESDYISFTLVYDTWYDETDGRTTVIKKTMGTYKVRKNTDWYTLIKIINPTNDSTLPSDPWGEEDNLENIRFGYVNNKNNGDSNNKLNFITKISGTYYNAPMDVDLKWPGIIGFKNGFLGDDESGNTYHPYIYRDIDGSKIPVHPANYINDGETYFINTSYRNNGWEFEDISSVGDEYIITKHVNNYYAWEEVSDPEYYI